MSERLTRVSVIVLSFVATFALIGVLPVALAPGTGASTGGIAYGVLPSSSHSATSTPQLGNLPASWDTRASGVPAGVQQFDQRVRSTDAALGASGIAPTDIRLPYVGAPARVVDGAVEPGPAVAAAQISPFYSAAPAPAGIAYYGESDTSGVLDATIVNASSVAGSLTVNQLSALYLDVDTPDDWGIQENAVLANVTLGGGWGNEFWTQNAVDYYQHNSTLNLGQDTWNFSSPGAFISPSDVLRHNPNGSFISGLYISEGPWIHTPRPFTLTLYLNSSVTSDHNQELWYNYSLTAAHGIHKSGNYDWLVFASGGHVLPSQIAPFSADGTQIDPAFSTNDFELVYGIGSYNGASNNVLAANAQATLKYCPQTVARCNSAGFQSVPAAVDFGSETGETSTGLAFTYSGTTESASAGPLVLRGLWGFQGVADGAAGSTAVTNDIKVSGSPLKLTSQPYFFVFLSTTSYYDSSFEWAPDAPVWHLAPGTYDYVIMLSDYAERTGHFTVGTSPITLSVTLPYHPASGVYTPLWAFSNDQLAGISSSGSGTIGHQYVLFNNPTSSCTKCGGAVDGNLSSYFFSANDFFYPTFAGILLDGTTAYTEVLNPPSFCTFWFNWGSGSSATNVCFDLQLEFVSAKHVTLAHADVAGGWPTMFEVEPDLGAVDPAQNFFPQGNVMFWNSSYDLVMSSTFVPTINPPGGGYGTPVTCFYSCISPDGLLFYGGSHNTVWGNTFHDPSVPATGDQFTSWEGLAESESGDLIYNNNFSIDNPVVWLPFDMYRDACPDAYAAQCGPLVPPAYHDTWDVPIQPASHVSDVVNGFALSGNILGKSYYWQGGNYWSNYGNMMNPIGWLPYVNTYNYSDYIGSDVLPPSTDLVHRSILVGGDYHPLLRAPTGLIPVAFIESGLPHHSAWEASIGSSLWYGSDSLIVLLFAPAGVQSFSLNVTAPYVPLSISGPNSPTLSSIDVTGPSTYYLHFGAVI
jgi:thermopsin